MVKIKHTCDICKDETDNTTRLPITVLVNKEGNIGASVVELDICDRCLFRACPVTFVDGQYIYNNPDAVAENIDATPEVVNETAQKYQYEEVKDE
jgi:hypothetical protein